jgi:hypothetical protein
VDLDEFCRARGVDLGSVAAAVDAAVGLEQDDALLAVGSLVEGIGNSKSDLDLLLITQRPEADLPAHEQVALILDRCVVDIRILRARDVDDLLGRLARWSRLPWDVTHAAGFGIEERTLLHRLCHRHVLWPEQGASDGFEPQREDVARLKLHSARQLARTIQVDLDGYVEDEDYRALVFAAQELLGHAVDALVAGYRLTNPLTKWRSKLLGSLPADWEVSVTVRPSGLNAADRVWKLHRAPNRPVRDECLEHALRISSIARAIFAAGELLLWPRLWMQERRLRWPDRKERDVGGTALPHLDFDVDFLLSDEGVTLGRLNDFGDTLTLSPGEFAVALLCDGVTTASEANAVAVATARGDRRLASDDVIARLAQAGLIRER